MSRVFKNGKVDQKKFTPEFIERKVVKDLKKLKKNSKSTNISDAVRFLVRKAKKEHPEWF